METELEAKTTPSPILRQIENAHICLSNLDKEIARLEERLAPVLDPPGQEATPEERCKAKSTLEGELSAIEWTVDTCIERIVQIRGRLSVLTI